MKTISLIVPCFNEEESIDAFYDAVKETFSDLSGYAPELIFINDGSSDGTVTKLKSIAARNEYPIKLISFSRNFGKEAAMLAGFRHVTGDFAVTIDADMQQPPALIKDMLHVFEKEPDYDSVVYYQEKRKESKLMGFIKKKFYSIINSISEVEFVAGASDFRMFRKNVVDAILELPEASRFSKGIFSWVGFNKKFLPYTPDERVGGASKWNFRKLMKYAISGITSFSVMPLKIASYIGSVISLLSFIYLIVILLQKLIFDIAVPGFPTIICTVLFLGGLQLLFMGILGEYLSKTFIESKHRPSYIIREYIDTRKDPGHDR